MKFNGTASRVLAAMCALVLSSSCATIVNGTHQPVAFSSNPEGAEVFVNGTARGVTPTTVELPRSSSDSNVVFKKVGYQDTTENLHSSISGYYFLNILLGGVIGLVLDAVDGAWYGYDGSVQANLPVEVAQRDRPAVEVAPQTPVNPAAVRATDVRSAPPAANPNVGDQWNPNDHPY
jgi:hypothetical protein